MNFTVDKPLHGHDEDAPAYADDRMLIVCDGLGGGGQNTYLVDGVKRTSAYLGSRRISAACQEFFSRHYDDFCANMQNPKSLVEELKKHISESLNSYVAEKGLRNIVKGKSMQMLPSTLAAIIYKHHEDHTDALVISAGDSRAFVLTPEKGLQQISKDDVFDNVDAFEKTATMTNNIRQDGAFHINYGYISLPPQCILLACTDGCFDYVSTPMELEYRFEYSISKCGELFDPANDNLGQHIGNLLVQSVLKDDCSVAGAILGYSDTNTTRSLFLKRAQYVAETFRKPFQLYEKESVKRKAEVTGKLPEQEAKATKLRADIQTTMKTALMTAFQHDLDETVESATNAIRELILSLRGFELYQSFITSLRQADEEATKNADAKNAEYLGIRTELRQLFKVMRFDEFVCNLTSLNPLNPMHFLNPERSRHAKEYKRLEAEANACGKAYVEARDRFSREFDALKLVSPKNIQGPNDFAPVAEQYMELQQAFYAFVAKKQEFYRCKEELRLYYMESDDAVEQEFISAWKGGFSAYKARSQYREIRMSYDRCIELQGQIETCVALTRDQKIEKFKGFLEENYAACMERIQSNPALCEAICGTIYVELAALEKQYEELKKYGSEFDDKKYALWLEYKPGYELFSHSLGGSV